MTTFAAGRRPAQGEGRRVVRRDWRLRYRKVQVRSVWLALLIMAAPAFGATQSPAADETSALRQASAYEAAGDYASAERLLQDVLARDPTSLSALLAYERVLTLQHGLERLLPAVDALIAVEPTSILAHQMRVRTLSVLNRVDSLERAGEAWMRATPRLETPYREVARTWLSRGDPERAVRVLERGRDRVGRADALALELGDAYAQLGDASRVIEEWARAIGPQGEAFLLVQRRLVQLPGGGASVIPGLVDALTRQPRTPARMKCAMQLAVDGGLAERASYIARELAGVLRGSERSAFLIEVGRRAEGARLRALALWAYETVAAEGGRSDMMLAVRSRIAELALALGDTAKAHEAFRLVQGEMAPGSPEYRQAAVLRVQVLIREQAWDSAATEVAALARLARATPELDASAAALANALLDAGRPEQAEQVLADVDGPHADFVRGRLYMARGEVERARNEILAAAPKLDGAEATEAIGLATLLTRLSAEGGRLVARSAAALAGGDRRGSVMLLYDGASGLADAERASILDFAASLADRAGLEAEAEQIRRDIVAETPDSPEAPAALLALARRQLARGGGQEEARQLLERLTLQYPRSALVPQAQRELGRLEARR